MRIVISVLAILFGLLHILAAITQLKSKDAAARGAAALMLCGSVLLIGTAIAHLVYGVPGDWMVALSAAACGFLPVCFAAYLNGKRAGKVNPLHHVIRGGIAVLLVVGFILW